MSVVMGIEYQGSCYRGWQCQNDTSSLTIQACLEKAISKVANEPIRVICAGRTDAGVHATSQVVNFTSNAKRTLRQWVLGVNSFLPDDIAVKWAIDAPSDFHARFSATYRHYQYLLLAKDMEFRSNNALFKNFVVYPGCKLDVDKMHNAAQCLLGKQDFSAFRARRCQAKSPVRNMHGISVKTHSDYIVIDVMANAFLYNMVRNIVGALCEVGANKRPESWIKEILDGKNREVGYKKMPANGLYLVGVGYPDFLEVDRLSHYNKIMLTSNHLPLVYEPCSLCLID